MKRIFIFMTALALLATACNKGQEFTLTGDLASAEFNPITESLLLQSDALPDIVTIPVQDGKFSYAGKVEKPAAATLKTVGAKTETRMVVLEKGAITFQGGLPAGTKLNDAASELSRSMRTIMKENAGKESALKTLRSYLSDHGKDASAVIAIMIARRFVSPEELSELIAMTSPEIQTDSQVHRIKKQLNSMLKKAQDQAE